MSHGRALRRHSKHRTTLVKYIHQILPLGKQIHRYDPKYSPECPSCHADIEDTAHFWICTAPTQLEWRRKFLKTLKTKLIQRGTGTIIRDLLVSKIRAVLDGADPDQIPTEPIVADICNKQKQIGWDQLLRGRFATAWGTHTSTPSGSQGETHRTWTTEVIDFIFTQWWLLWESRNQDKHGRDLVSKHQATARQVDRELQIFYDEYEDQAPQHLRWIFDTPIEVRRQWPTTAMQQWLSTWGPILYDALNPEAAPTNPENYPYSTPLETG